jgi:hypothetical protein
MGAFQHIKYFSHDVFRTAYDFKVYTKRYPVLYPRLSSTALPLTKSGAFLHRDGLCALCGEIEHVDHIFFQCPPAQFMWSGVRDMLSVSWNPSSRVDWFRILDSLGERSKRMVWIFFRCSMLGSLDYA